MPRLKAAGWSLAVAESLTGGLLGATITRVPGAGDVFRGGIICYQDGVKEDHLRVSHGLIEKVGSVSEAVACEMARGCLEEFDADVAVSLTGFAGPDAPGGMPVGLVYIGLAREGSAVAHEYRFSGDRTAVREQTVEAALRLVLDALGPG